MAKPAEVLQSDASHGLPKPINSQIRSRLDKELPTAADLDAFCLDYFRDVMQGFGPGMNRKARITHLLENRAAEEIIAALDRNSDNCSGAAGGYQETTNPASAVAYHNQPVYPLGTNTLRAQVPDSSAQIILRRWTKPFTGKRAVPSGVIVLMILCGFLVGFGGDTISGDVLWRIGNKQQACEAYEAACKKTSASDSCTRLENEKTLKDCKPESSTVLDWYEKNCEIKVSLGCRLAGDLFHQKAHEATDANDKKWAFGKSLYFYEQSCELTWTAFSRGKHTSNARECVRAGDKIFLTNIDKNEAVKYYSLACSMHLEEGCKKEAFYKPLMNDAVERHIDSH